MKTENGENKLFAFAFAEKVDAADAPTFKGRYNQETELWEAAPGAPISLYTTTAKTAYQCSIPVMCFQGGVGGSYVEDSDTPSCPIEYSAEDC